MKIFIKILVAILIIISSVIIIKVSTIGYSNKEVIAIEVKDKYIKRQGSGEDARDIYMIVDADNNTYQVSDLLFMGKFNSTDIYNTLEIGQVYLVEVTGIRNNFFSMYRNINKIIDTIE